MFDEAQQNANVSTPSRSPRKEKVEGAFSAPSASVVLEHNELRNTYGSGDLGPQIRGTN